MHFVNTYSTSESTITGFVDEIAKIEKWPYAGTDMAMIGFKSVNSEGKREDVNLAALNSIITGADSTRKITFLYTKNPYITYNLSNYFPYLKVLIAPEMTDLLQGFFFRIHMSLVNLPKISYIKYGFEGNSFSASETIFEHDAFSVNELFLSNLTTLNYPGLAFTIVDKIEVPLLSSIGQGAFTGIRHLSYIKLPEATIIPIDCFSHALSLQTVILPKCELIKDTGFQDCTSLKSIYLNSSSMTTISSTAFNGTPLVSTGTSAAIYVPSSLISNYQEAYSEFPFSDKFKPIVGDIL